MVHNQVELLSTSWMISTCQSLINISLNHQSAWSDKSLTMDSSTTEKNCQFRCTFMTSCSLLAWIPSLDHSTLTFVFHVTSQWSLASPLREQFFKQSIFRYYKTIMRQWISSVQTWHQRSSMLQWAVSFQLPILLSLHQQQSNSITSSIWEILQESSKICCLQCLNTTKEIHWALSECGLMSATVSGMIG